ncbi:MAG: DNA polymerase III subunit beta [Lachnospiraceae bacterium]|nr:DNA polymerase III subunit beta [Lachnospiraceae bacterium]MBQ9464602.1 DNA polymerase III subunit beta [Lachnospiraceae bacterium]MBR0107152.1 DNA polymerase III subunit beta [Lachnospiraceae bacterium]
MKISIQRSELAEALSIVTKAVPSRTTLPILECVLVEVSGSRAMISANDTEIGIQTIVKCETAEEGTVAIDAKIFTQIIRKLPENVVTIATDENYKVSIDCEASHFDIPGKDPEEFPEIPRIRTKSMYVISHFMLREMVNRTNFSIAPIEERGNALMSGQLFEVKDDFLRIVSLDGYRISIRREQLKDHSENISVVIPGKAIADVAKLLSGDNEKEATITVDDNHIMFEFDDTRVVCRLVDGNYFAIDNILSLDYETKIVVNRRRFLDCVERSSLLVREMDKKPVILNIKDGNMNISMRTGIGKMDEDIDIMKMGGDIMIGLNPKFLSDALKAIDDEEVSVYLINPKAPCYIRDDRNSYNYVIQPVNFKVTED